MFKAPLAAIRVVREYNDRFMDGFYIQNTKDEIEQYLEDVKADPTKYEVNQQIEDSLGSKPTLTVSTMNGMVPFRPTVQLVAEMKYTYNTKPVEQARSNFGLAVVMFIFACTVLGAIGMKKAFQIEHLNQTCNIYTKHGQPVGARVDYTEYTFPLSEMDLLQMNPWHRQILSDAEKCITVRTE